MGEVLWLRLFPKNLFLCDFQENPLLPHFSLFFCWIVEGNISKTGPLCGRDLLKTYGALLSYICFFFLLLSLLWSISHCWRIAITLRAHIAIIYIYHILVSWYCGIVTILLSCTIATIYITSLVHSFQLSSSSTLWISKQKQNWIFWSVHSFDPNCTHSKLEFSTKIWFQQYIMYHYVALSLSNIKQMTKNLEIIILKWKKTWAINTLYIALLSATWQTQIWMNIKKISSKYQ